MEGWEVPKFTLFILAIAAVFIGLLWVNNPQKVNTDRYLLSVELDIPSPALQKFNNPQISAQGALVLERSSNKIVFSKNARLRFSLASATKIMTALVALSHYNIGDVLTVDNEKVLGSSMKLVPGEKITVEALLYGMLLPSGNDAAYTLAKNYPGGFRAYVEVMNNTSQKLGLLNTYFTDPAGINDDENFTTVLELATLANVALQNPIFAKIVETREKVVFDKTGRFKHELVNLNKLLGEVAGVKGVKTGSTERAGGVLVTLVKQQERELLIVIFRSADRFKDTKALIDWASQ